MQMFESGRVSAAQNLWKMEKPIPSLAVLVASRHRSLSTNLIGVCKPHGPPCRIVVNRDSFRDLGFGAALEFHRPSPGFRAS